MKEKKEEKEGTLKVRKMKRGTTEELRKCTSGRNNNGDDNDDKEMQLT